VAAVKFKDYYDTIGVKRTATQDEIQKAFRKLARKCHPDVNRAPNAEARFKELNEAYEVLKDPEKRKRYDALGANWKAGQEFQPPPGSEGFQFHFGGPGRGRAHPGAGGEGFTNFSDFFSMLFGQAAEEKASPHGGRRVRASFGAGGFDRGQHDAFFGQAPLAQEGEDQEAELEVTLEEAAKGSTRSLTLEQTHAGGTDKRTLHVTIPAGVTAGSKIRLTGQGLPGQGGAPAGDLYLKIHLAPHPIFEAQGHDLTTTLRLTPWEAALGASVSVPTLDGSLKMKIPAGTQGGHTLRLREKGLPKRHGTPGDLLVKITIAIPTQLSPRERELLEELGKVSKLRPRE